MRWLSRAAGTEASDKGLSPKLIVCTGERMESLVNKLYRSFGLATTDFEPTHARGLSNEFYCYANFECNSWRWRPQSGAGSA